MLELKDGRYHLQGPVTLETVKRLLDEGARRFEGDRVLVDLSGVTQVDSAAVGLLLSWARDARAGGRDVQFVNSGDNLRALISLYEVGEFLPVI